MSNFQNILNTNTFQGNIVLSIGGVYYSQFQVDSGLTVPDTNVGTVKTISISPSQVDFLTVKTSVSSLTFSLLDKDGEVSKAIFTENETWINKEVIAYFGFIRGAGNFAWNDYIKISTTRIKTVRKITNGYSFSAKESTGLIQERSYTTRAELNGNITDAVTTIDLEDSLDESSFPTSGTIYIDGEYIDYTGHSSFQLTGCTRGQLGSDAASHDSGDDVYLVTKLEDKAMNIILDILQNELSIATSLIDITSFTNLRDGIFSGEGDFTLYAHDVADTLIYIEENLLKSTNTRFQIREGLISIALLDAVSFVGDAEEINENHIRKTPNYHIDGNKIRNKIYVKYDYSPGSQSYATTAVFTDADSVASFGEKSYTLNMPGVTTGNGGASITTDRGNRLLARLAAPRGELEIETHFNRYLINTADSVLVTSRNLPQSGTGILNFENILEVLSKAVSGFDKEAKIRWKVGFTSYAGLRYGLIAPSPLIASVISQKSVTVPDGTQYEVGYELQLMNDTTKTYYADSPNPIESISGNTLVFENSFVTVLSTSIRLVFPEYDNATDAQKNKYAYVSPNTGIFVSDGAKAYQIIL